MRAMMLAKRWSAVLRFIMAISFVVGGVAPIGGSVEVGDVVGGVAVGPSGAAEVDRGEQRRQRRVFIGAHDAISIS